MIFSAHTTSTLRTVLLLAGLTRLGACLLPPPFDESPPVDNLPPKILQGTLTPNPIGAPLRLQTGCVRYSFVAAIDEPNLADVVYWRFFIDYFSDPAPHLTPIQKAETNATNPQAPRLIEFGIDPNDPRFRDESPHVIELLISDRPFLTDARPPLGRAAEDDALMDNFQWAVDIEEGACPATGGQL